METCLLKFIIAPLLAILGIVIVGHILEDILGIQHATMILFIAVGGFYFLATLFRKAL